MTGTEKNVFGSIPSEGGADSRALNTAMGWIVAVWLLLAGFNSGYAPYLCMGGAMLTVILWALIARFLSRPRTQPEEGQ